MPIKKIPLFNQVEAVLTAMDRIYEPAMGITDDEEEERPHDVPLIRAMMVRSGCSTVSRR